MKRRSLLTSNKCDRATGNEQPLKRDRIGSLVSPPDPQSCDLLSECDRKRELTIPAGSLPAPTSSRFRGRCGSTCESSAVSSQHSKRFLRQQSVRAGVVSH